MLTLLSQGLRGQVDPVVPAARTVLYQDPLALRDLQEKIVQSQAQAAHLVQTGLIAPSLDHKAQVARADHRGPIQRYRGQAGQVVLTQPYPVLKVHQDRPGLQVLPVLYQVLKVLVVQAVLIVRFQAHRDLLDLPVQTLRYQDPKVPLDLQAHLGQIPPSLDHPVRPAQILR